MRPGSLALACVQLVRAGGRGLALFARPRVAGPVALAIYLLRASFLKAGLRHTDYAYFNFLADAFLHGQLSLRLPPFDTLDLIYFAGKEYVYWPPFPAIVIAPLVGLFGVGVSDIIYTAAFGALAVALLAALFAALDRTGLAPLSVERRSILVVTCAFGSVLLTLAPLGKVWFTGQLVGFDCVLVATLAALTRRGRLCYLLVGTCLACALATRVGLVFNGVWLAYYLFRRDYVRPRQWGALALWTVAPVALAGSLLAWYNAARFGSPLDMGLAYHHPAELFRADFERYGVFHLHYLPTNLYYQFVAYTPFTRDRWMGGGLFWMTPVFLGALYAIWRGRSSALVWSLVLSCLLVYIPIGLVMGTGYLTFGPRYLLDLMVPLLVLTALGIRRWPVSLLLLLLRISVITYALGSVMLQWT